MVGNIDNFTETIKISIEKVVDSYTASAILAVFSINALEVTGKVLAALLSVILIIRGFYNVRKAIIDRKSSKLEEEKLEYELKIKKLEYERMVEEVSEES